MNQTKHDFFKNVFAGIGACSIVVVLAVLMLGFGGNKADDQSALAIQGTKASPSSTQSTSGTVSATPSGDQPSGGQADIKSDLVIQINLAPNTPPSRAVQAGDKDVVFGIYKLSTAKIGVRVDTVSFKVYGFTSPGDLVNWKLYDEADKTKTILGTSTDGKKFILKNKLYISAKSSKSLVVVGDISPTAGINNTASISLTDLTAIGLPLNKPVDKKNIAWFGLIANTMTIARQDYCLVTATAEPEPVSQDVSVGTNNFTFTKVKLLSKGCDANVTAIRAYVGGSIAPKQISTSLRNLNLKVGKGSLQVGQTFAVVQEENTFNFSYTIFDGKPTYFYIASDVIGGAGLNARIVVERVDALDTRNGVSIGTGTIIADGKLMNIVK